MRYNQRAIDMILKAGQHARRLGHSYVGSAHLLLAMGNAGGSGEVLLRNAGVENSMILLALQGLYGVGTVGMPLPQGWTPQE